MFFKRFANSIWMARWCAAVLAVGAFMLYRTTLHPGFAPGAPASMSAIVLGLQPAPDHQWLLWRLVGRMVSLLPYGSLSVRLNLMSAVFGAASVALLFALVRALLLIVAFRASILASVRRKHAGVVAGLVSALALGASVPFWLAATRSLPHTFEIFLILVCCWLLVRTAVSCHEMPLALAGGLIGLSMLEWQTGLILALPLCFFAWRAMGMGLLGDARGFVALFGGIALGLLLYLLLDWTAGRLLGSGDLVRGSFVSPLRSLVVNLKQLYGLTLRGGWRNDPRMLSVISFVVMPWLATVALAIWRTDDRASSSGGLLMLALAGTTLIALVGVTISPWGAYRVIGEQGLPYRDLPCTVYLLVALVAGYLAGQGCLLARGRCWPEFKKRGRRMFDREEHDSGDVADSAVGRLAVWFTVLLCLTMAFINFDEVRSNREPLSRLLARKVVARMSPDRHWLVSGTPRLNTLVKLYAYESRHAIKTIDDSIENVTPAMLEHARRVIFDDPAFDGLDKTRLQSALATNAHVFLETWVALDRDAPRKLFVLTPDTFWAATGLRTLPEVVGYGGLRPEEQPDLERLLAEHEAFWDRVDRMPPAGMRAPAWMRGHRSMMRQQVHDVGARLAARFAEQGESDKADAILGRMRRLREEPRGRRRILPPES